VAEAQLELGTLLVQRKQNERAATSFVKAIQLKPDSEMAHYRLAQIYRNLNKLALAERELDIYRKLARDHKDEMAQTRGAIRQFVLAKPSSDQDSPERRSPL